MFLIVFEKWTAYVCFLKKLKITKPAQKTMRRKGGGKG